MSPPSIQSKPSNKSNKGKGGGLNFEMPEKNEPVDVDSQVIPALGNKGKNPPQEYEYGEEDEKEVEELSGDKIVQA